MRDEDAPVAGSIKVDTRCLADEIDPALLHDPRTALLAEWGRRLDTLGIAPGAAGNLSFRTESGFLITRTEVELRDISLDDWVEVTGIEREASGALIVSYRGAHRPSRDSFVHGTVYRRRASVGAIFHLHDREMLEAADRLGIHSTERFFPAGTIQSVGEIERLLDRHPDVDYFILIEHGIVAVGDTLDTAGDLVVFNHGRATGG